MPTFEELYSERLNVELNSADSTVLYTSTRRAQAINDAQEEFADLTECFIRQSSVTVSCGTTEYMVLATGVLGGGSGSTDYVRLAKQGLEYNVLSSGSSRTTVTHLAGDDFPQRPIEFRNKEYPGWRGFSTVATTPTGYYLREDGGNLYVGLDANPKVGSSQRASITVPYVARPAPMTSSGALPWTGNSTTRSDLTIYHKALPHYAAYKLLPLIGDTEGAKEQLQKFLGYVSRYLQSKRPKGGTLMQLGHNYLKAARGSRRRGTWDRPSNVPTSQWE